MTIKDNYQVSGTDLQEFMREVCEMDKNTAVKSIKKNKISFIMPYKDPKKIDKGISYAYFNPRKPIKYNRSNLSLKKWDHDPKKELLDAGYDEDIINESIEKGMFVKIGKTIIPVSDMSIFSLSNRAGIAGAAASQNNVLKTAFIASNFNNDDEIKIVERKNESDENYKVFAFMSKDYSRINQAIAFEIIEKSRIGLYDLGEPICTGWEIDHSISRIYMEFPEKAKEVSRSYLSYSFEDGEIDYKATSKDKITPGIMVETSDIGDSAFRLSSFIKINNSLVFVEEYEKVHTGVIDMTKVVEDAEANIFPRITIFPQMMEDLSAEDCSIKLENAENYISEVLHKSGIDKEIGKRKTAQAIEKFCEDIKTYPYSVSDNAYILSLYDVLSFVATLGESGVLEKDVQKEKLSKKIYKLYQIL
jgi:hypothetical protein